MIKFIKSVNFASSGFMYITSFIALSSLQCSLRKAERGSIGNDNKKKEKKKREILLQSFSGQLWPIQKLGLYKRVQHLLLQQKGRVIPGSYAHREQWSGANNLCSGMLAQLLNDVIRQFYLPLGFMAL